MLEHERSIIEYTIVSQNHGKTGVARHNIIGMPKSGKASLLRSMKILISIMLLAHHHHPFHIIPLDRVFDCPTSRGSGLRIRGFCLAKHGMPWAS